MRKKNPNNKKQTQNPLSVSCLNDAYELVRFDWLIMVKSIKIILISKVEIIVNCKIIGKYLGKYQFGWENKLLV